MNTSIRALAPEMVVPEYLNLENDILERSLAVEESYGRVTRKRKKPAGYYDVAAKIKAERRSTVLAREEARREKVRKNKLKRQRIREKKAEEKRQQRLADKWTREKKAALMEKFNELKALDMKNHGTFIHEHDIAVIYEVHGYTFNFFNRFKKECLDEMEIDIEKFLTDARNYKKPKGTSKQHDKIEQLYGDLMERLESDDISEEDCNKINDKMEKHFTAINIPQKDDQFELDVDIFSYKQCNEFIDFLLICLVECRVAKERHSYRKYKLAISKLNETIKKYKQKN